MLAAECGGSGSADPSFAGASRGARTAAVVVAVSARPSSTCQALPCGPPRSASVAEWSRHPGAHPVVRDNAPNRCPVGADSSAVAQVRVANSAACFRSAPDYRGDCVGDPDELLVAGGASLLRTVVECGRTLLSLAQNGEMGAHPTDLAGASGSHFLLGLNFLTVTVVLEPVMNFRDNEQPDG